MRDKKSQYNSRQIRKMLERMGYRLDRHNGDHAIMVNHEQSIPVPAGTISENTLHSILRAVGIRKKDLPNHIGKGK